MLISALKRPITVINLEDYGLNSARFLARTAECCQELVWDQYLLRQQQIEFLQSMLPEHTTRSCSDRFWLAFYLGSAPHSDVNALLADLSHAQRAKYRGIRPIRRRAISEFRLRFHGTWCIERVPASAFGQDHALIAEEDTCDYRVAQRTFQELRDDMVDDDLLHLLRALAAELHEKETAITALNAFVHHTQIACYPEQEATNSPEGIHQDGMDYIVSALVVARENITGGKSVIYGNDKQTKLLEIELQPGQGILQPDRDTDLWHAVTPIQCRDASRLGVRSSIGFDFTVGAT